MNVRTVRLVTRTALPLLAMVAGTAVLAQPSPAGAQQPPPQPAPYDQPWGGQPPVSGQPPVGGQPGAPGVPPGAPPTGPGAEQQPGGFGAGFGAQGSANFGGAELGLGAEATAGAETKVTTQQQEWEDRDRSLIEQVGLSGSTGLLHTSLAGSGAEGTFRVGFLMDWFTTGGFLCNSDTPCRSLYAGQEQDDSASHVGALFSLNMTPFSFLEAYAAIRTYANSNDHGSPQLLQVLGDTTFGAKGFMPERIGGVLGFGGEARLLLLNSAGSVGPAGGGTSAEFMALTTADFRKEHNEGFPLRLNLNLGYRLDNSGIVVEDVEALRAERNPSAAGGLGRIPISRIERYGLGINRVDFFKINFGVDVPWDYVQPFAEYTVDIPVNRQGYECHTRTISSGDVCLALQDLNDPMSGAPGYSAAPSRLTIGARTTPFEKSFRGLSATLAFDIGLSATSTFIEEVAPQAPWTLYLGLGYAFDTQERKVEAPPAPPPPPPPVQLPPPPEYFARGVVKEAGTTTMIANAIITVEGRTEPPVATAADGRFLTYKLDVGQFNLAITAEGYKPGVCPVTIAAAVPALPAGLGGPEAGAPTQPGMPPGMGAPTQPGFPPGLGAPTQPGFPPGAATQPGVPPGPGVPPTAEPAVQPTGPIFTDVECQLEALPRKGDVEGAVMDSAGGRVGDATVEIIDAEGKVNKLSAAGGSFSLKGLPPGKAKVKAEAKDYMLYNSEFTVAPRETAKVTVTLVKRPTLANVRIFGNEIRISKQIHFDTDSARIMGDSNELMAEIADVIHRNPTAKKIEIQGHTDNTGTKEHNDKLSQDRADAVRTWLTGHGIDGSRLTAKGYGQSRPIAPNVTPANRARNRRVQFMILEKQ
jgi:outer membrane protein OmpA-like peptidoglycan-associated protein